MADKYDTKRANPDSLSRLNPTLGVAGTAAPITAKALVFAGDCVFTSTDESAVTTTTDFPALKGMPVPFVPDKVTAMTPTTVFWWVN